MRFPLASPQPTPAAEPRDALSPHGCPNRPKACCPLTPYAGRFEEIRQTFFKGLFLAALTLAPLILTSERLAHLPDSGFKPMA